MGCSTSKASQVHSPGPEHRSGSETNKHEAEKSNESILPCEKTTDDVMSFTEEDVKAADEEAVICGGIEPPGTVPSESLAKPVAESTPEKVESKPPSPTVEPSEATTRCQSTDSEKLSREGASPSLLVFELQPVSVLETEMKDVFNTYKARIQPQFGKTLDCTWEKLELEMTECKSAGITLEWFWIVRDKVTNAPVEAHGLVVIKFHKMHSSKKCEVVHLSVAGDDWEPKIPPVIDMMRRELFKNAIRAIHVTLWYAHQADNGKFAIDSAVESAFKEKGFRWYQLTNEDGKRGQIMALKRTVEADPAMPEEVYDLTVSLCTFMAVGCDGTHQDTDDATVRAGAMGSRLMIAECLRRHGEDLQIEETFKIGGNSEDPVCSVPANDVEDVMTRLRKRKKAREICSKDATNAPEAEEFVKECLPSLSSKTKAEISTWLKKKEGVEHIICGGVGLGVDWLEYTSGMTPQVRVPVRMLAKSTAIENPLVYLGTSDEDIFIIVWACEKDDTLCRQEFIQQCVNTLRVAEPIEEPLPFNEVLLPRFELQSFEESDDIHHPPFQSMASDMVHKPRELISVKLTDGQAHPGALQRAAPEKAPYVLPLTSTGSFVFCVWHANLDDLEEPLFVARIDASN